MYLEERYKTNFTIIKPLSPKKIGEEVKYAYRVIDTNNIEFTAGKKREKMLFPLLPGFTQLTFFDDYVKTQED